MVIYADPIHPAQLKQGGPSGRTWGSVPEGGGRPNVFLSYLLLTKLYFFFREGRRRRREGASHGFSPAFLLSSCKLLRTDS